MILLSLEQNDRQRIRWKNPIRRSLGLLRVLSNFDLTTPEGREAAIEAFDKYGWALNLWVWLARKTYKAMRDNAVATTEAQKSAAIDLIKAGRDNNVESMRIKLDRTAGIDLGSEVEGIPIKLKVGDSGTVEVEVHYKTAS